MQTPKANIHYSAGALHIHSTYSDGSGSVEAIIRAAQGAGLEWIILTDHDTLAGLPYQGWHDNLLVIVGHEITPDRNHFLALNVDQVISNTLAPQDFVDEVYARGGFGIIAHPDERVANAVKDIYRWDDWSVDGPRQREGRVIGIELWNQLSDWGEHYSKPKALLHYLFPRIAMTGPTPKTLKWWDELNMAGKRTFGVGGVDAHAIRQRVPGGHLEVFPYPYSFRTITNYLLLDQPLSRDAETAINQVYAALTAGRSYFVNRLDGEVPALSFNASRLNERSDDTWIAGDTVQLAGSPLLISADAKADAYLRLIHNGRVVTSGIRSLRHSINQPGIYRLEGYRGGRPWFYTNPIYVIE